MLYSTDDETAVKATTLPELVGKVKTSVENNLGTVLFVGVVVRRSENAVPDSRLPSHSLTVCLCVRCVGCRGHPSTTSSLQTVTVTSWWCTRPAWNTSSVSTRRVSLCVQCFSPPVHLPFFVLCVVSGRLVNDVWVYRAAPWPVTGARDTSPDKTFL